MSPDSPWLASRTVAEVELNTGLLAEVLREYRNAHGINQADLAQILNFDQSYISKIETGQRQVRDIEMLLRIARQLDISPNRLGISHELLRPVAPPVTSAVVGTVDPVEANQERGFRPPRRSDDAAPVPAALITAAALVGDGDGDAFDRLAVAVAQPRRVDATVVEHLAAVLAQQRQLEDVVGARRMLPAVLAEVELIERLAQEAGGPVRADLVGLASEYRQFAGWMGEDTGDHVAALAHYDRAMDAAQETGDANMVTSVLSLKSHLAWSEQDAARAVGLAVAGQRDTARVSPGVLALIVQQEARGHALDGDGDAVDRLLDRTEELTATAAEHPADEPAWVYFHTSERVLFQRGVAYVELGRHAAAVELFDAARGLLPAGYRRDHGRYAASLAMAAALDGQVDRAVAAGREALAVAVETGSAHTVADLRRMRRALDRWDDAPAVAEFDAALADAGTGARTAGCGWRSTVPGTC